MNVLIAGCGYVGTALATRLRSTDHRVWGLRRRVELLPEGVEPWGANLTDPMTLRNPPARFDALVYCAAPKQRSESAYREAYVDGLRNILAVAQHDDWPVRRLVFTSSTGVYNISDGAWVDEDSPVTSPTETAQCLLQGEQLALESGYSSCVVRFGGIYGPGRTRMAQQVARGEAHRHRGLRTFTNRIHRDDCAGVLQHVLDLNPISPIYLGVDCDPADYNDVVAWLADRMGRPRPAWVDAPGPRRGSKRCSNRRLLASGYRFQYPSFRDGYGALVQREPEPSVSRLEASAAIDARGI